MVPIRLLPLVFSAAVSSDPGSARDQWLQVDPFRSAIPVTTSVELFTGDFEHPELVQRRPATQYVRFDLRVPRGSDPMLDRLLETGPAICTLDMARLGLGANTYVLALDTMPSTSERGAAPFNAWLRKEGLQEVLSQRAKQGHEAAPGEERHTHHMKAIFQRGPDPSDFVTMPVGQDLEIVTLQNPNKLAVESSLPVLVLFHGQPLVGRTVTAWNRYDGRVRTKTARTDALGRASFVLDHPGDWLLRAVNLEPSKEPDADWRSYWASLTFSMGP
jgi:hypothetical protein